MRSIVLAGEAKSGFDMGNEEFAELAEFDQAGVGVFGEVAFCPSA